MSYRVIDTPSVVKRQLRKILDRRTAPLYSPDPWPGSTSAPNLDARSSSRARHTGARHSAHEDGRTATETAQRTCAGAGRPSSDKARASCAAAPTSWTSITYPMAHLSWSATHAIAPSTHTHASDEPQPHPPVLTTCQHVGAHAPADESISPIPHARSR